MRHRDWQARLHRFLAAQLRTPHEWGSSDCLMLCGGAVKAVTGKDHARGHRGKYDSPTAAYRYLRRKFGVDSPETLLDKFLPSKRVGFAGEGDLVLCRVDSVAGETGEGAGNVPGVVAAAGNVAFVAGVDGLERVPRGDRWLKAWAVGEHHSGEDAHG